ncbi:MAG: hypothetical protein ACI8Z5_001161 [Lentimonas sp.]|jgi:hypothetical protein
MSLLVDSLELNAELRELLEVDFELRNAWHLPRHEDGSIYWESDGVVLDEEPADSSFQRLEDWFLAHLPGEGELYFCGSN